MLIVGDERGGLGRVPTVSFVVRGERPIRSKNVVEVFDKKGGVRFFSDPSLPCFVHRVVLTSEELILMGVGRVSFFRSGSATDISTHIPSSKTSALKSTSTTLRCASRSCIIIRQRKCRGSSRFWRRFWLDWLDGVVC